MKRTFFQRLMIGIKKGYNTPTLPENIQNIHNNLISRVGRVLGGISLLLLLSRRYLGLAYPYNKILFYVLMGIVMLFTVYSIYISYHSIIHMYKIFKNNELDVKNSPLD